MSDFGVAHQFGPIYAENEALRRVLANVRGDRDRLAALVADLEADNQTLRDRLGDEAEERRRLGALVDKLRPYLRQAHDPGCAAGCYADLGWCQRERIHDDHDCECGLAELLTEIDQ